MPNIFTVLITCTVIGITGYNNLKGLTTSSEIEEKIGAASILLAFYSILTALLSGGIVLCFLLFTCGCITSTVDSVYKEAVEKVNKEMTPQTETFCEDSSDNLLESSLEEVTTK